jgi:hypothetical protein
MKQLWLLLVSWLIFGSLPMNDAHAQQRSIVRGALPGTIEPVILDHIGPHLQRLEAIRSNFLAPLSIALTNRIASGELKPDVYISSDANQMKFVVRTC